MDDDFNTPKAFASLFEFVNKTNKFFEQHSSPNPGLCRYALDVYVKIGSVLTLFQPEKKVSHEEDTEVVHALQTLLQSCEKTIESPTIEGLMQALLDAREEARKRKDWTTADRIRKNLEHLGFEIQDTVAGPVWRKK